VRYLNIGRLLIWSICLITVWACDLNPVFSAPLLAHVATEAVGNASRLSETSAEIPSTFNVTFALDSAAELSASSYVDSLTDPTSPNYHHWLTPHQYGEKFGASLADITSVVNYLQSHGFSGIKVWQNRLFVSANLPATAVPSTFNVSIRSYVRTPSEIARGFSPTYYAPDAEPTIDSNIASKLVGIFGLSSAGAHRSTLTKADATPDTGSTGLNPTDLASIYNGAALHSAGLEGAGETIAIFSPTAYHQSDINTFLADENITGTNINQIIVNGGTTNLTYQDEACVDIETVAGQAPASKINVYQGPNDGSLNIFNQMAEDDPNIVTMSYGTDENAVTAAYANAYESLRRQMAAEGITIIVASGDTGSYDDVNQSTVTVSVDASSAYVTSVGGTELTNLSNDIWNGEVAWTYNDYTLGSHTGSGGGLSIYYAEPQWQTGPGVSNSFSNGMRQIPDVSMIASTPYYNIFTGGSFAAYGGTSCSCQLFGATMALVEEQVGQRLGNINPQLYSYGASDEMAYHDITSGNNGIYPCTAGWDFVTGWGSPNFVNLALAFQGTYTSPSPIHAFAPGLQMISVPYSFASTDSAGEVLNGLVTPSGAVTYSIAAWQPDTFQYAVSPSPAAATTVPGQGYWVRFDGSSGGSLTAEGTTITSSTYSVPLSPGWNIVGDPYTSPVSIDSLQISTFTGTTSFDDAATAGLILPYFYDYNGTGYVTHGSGDVLTPYDGYWIRSLGDATLIFTKP